MIDFQPIDETNNSIDFQPIDNEEQQYKRPAGDKGWDIQATPKKNLFDKIGDALNWVKQMPVYAYMEGDKNVNAAELNAKEIFKPLSTDEKAQLDSLENITTHNFGVPTEDQELAASHTGDLADWASEGGVDRLLNAKKRGDIETFRNLPTSIEVMKAGGIGSAVVGSAGALGGLLWGLKKGKPIEGLKEGFSLGIRLGGGAGAARKSFELEAGFARQELKQMRDKDGNPLPMDLVNNAALSVGAINAGLESVGMLAELKTFPGADKLFKNAKSTLIQDIATNESLRNKLIQVGKQYAQSTAIESSTEMIQEFNNILADELSKKVAGNFDSTPLEKHISRIISAGVGAIGPSLVIGGVGTVATTANILRKNGMDKVQADKAAKSMSLDDRANFINENLDTLDALADDHVAAIESKNFEKQYFDKAIEVYKDKDGNISAKDENIVFSASKIMGDFLKKNAPDAEAAQGLMDKVEFTNKPLEGGVSMDVQASKEIPFDELTGDNVPEVVFQKSAALAGAEKADVSDAAIQWKEKGTDSPYFQKWFSDSKVTNDEGKPIVVYHGTDAKFSEFNGTSWFTDNKEKADEYSEVITPGLENRDPHTMATYIDIKKPKYVNTWVVNEDVEKYFKSNKYDGIIVKNVGGGDSNFYIVKDPSQVKSVDNQGTFSKQTGNIYHQFAGQKAETADGVKLQEATGRLEAGENAEAVRKSTGWFKGVDGKMRFEISDKDAKINESFFDENFNKRSGLLISNLGELLDHQRLFAAYPNAKDISVTLNIGDVKPHGSFRKVSEVLSALGKEVPEIDVWANDKQEALDIILHEIQHYIQRKEGFARGGNLDTRSMASDVWAEIDELNSKMSTLVKENDAKSFDEKEKFKDEFRKKYDTLMSQREDLSSTITELQANPTLAYEKYKSLAGEAEARQTKARASFDDDWRRGVSPIDTMDVHANNQVVVFDDGTEVAYEPKTYYQEKKSLEELHADNLQNKAEKKLEYLGYFQEGADKNIIGIMEDANPSTIIHEMGHLFLQGLNEFASSDENSKQSLAEVNEWLGYDGGGYTVDQQEKFARGFEAYLYKGNAPSNKLREVFENFKEWLRSVYNHIDELGVKVTPDVQRIFDNIFSEKSSKENQVKEIVERAKNLDIGGKLSDEELRHKEAAYHILSVAVGKSKTWLKTVLESNSENPKILKSKEKIQLSMENVSDRISGSDGFLPEWSEFFFNPGIGSETHADYQLASAAYNTIVDKSYMNNASGQYGFLDRTEVQYQYLVDQFKRASDRDVPLAAFWEWLDTIDSDFVMTYADKYEKDVAYIERFEKMDKFAQTKEMILKSAREAGLYSINEVDRYKNIVKAAIKGLNFLNPMAKARLTANILDYSSVSLLEAQIDNLLDIAKTMEDIEYKKRLVASIHKELQFTKNIKQSNKTVGKYDYQSNKTFEQMREIDALSAEQADEMRLELGDIHEENGLEFKDKIINAFVNYKANGLAYTSTEAAKAMYDDIIKMKLAGKEAKSEEDFQNKLNLSSDVIELVRVLDKKKVSSGVTKWYLETFANWESMINGIFNKDMRDKYSLLAPQRKADEWIYDKKKFFEKQVARIYGRTMANFDAEIIKKLQEKMTIYEKVEDVENIGEFRTEPREINKMEMILVWMWNKNEVLHERLLNQFGDGELEKMLSEVEDSEQDMELGDLMMHLVDSFYPLVNETFIKKYGIDLPRVERYFMSKVERISEIDLLTDFALKSTDPSAVKHRSNSIGLTMDLDNPVKMLYQHIDSMGKFIHMTETLDKQNKIFKNKTLRKIVIVKYGEDTYNEMLKMFMNNAYKQDMQNYNKHQKIIDDLISNWLTGNIAIKPSIAIKQLLSASNYASPEGMSWAKWSKGFFKAVADPKGTIKLMNKIPYLKARFEMGGQNEFLKNEISNSKTAKVKKFKEWVTFNIRLGDVGAIAFGGRPYLEYLINDKKMSEQAAINEFLNHTQRTMQASETSTLSNFQIKNAKEKSYATLFTAYRNAQWQYLRMAGDSIVSYANGDITGQQMAKTLFMYMYLNPFMYRSATSLSIVTALATGKGDDLKDDLIGSLFDLNADAHALFGELYQYAISKLILHEKVFPAKMPLIGDIQEHISKIGKEDVSIEDYMNFAGYGALVGTGIPVNSVAVSLSGAGDIAQGKFLKGGLKVLGWSDKRAAHASGEKEPKHKRKKHKHKLNL